MLKHCQSEHLLEVALCICIKYEKRKPPKIYIYFHICNAAHFFYLTVETISHLYSSARALYGIIGGVVGGMLLVVILILVVIAILAVCKKKKKKTGKMSE